jgi:hypothetical protein
MNTAHARKKLVASAVGTAVAALVLLFLGAGIAQAGPPTAQDGANLTVSYDGDLLGVGLTVHVANVTEIDSPCSHTASPEPGQLATHLLQPYEHDFVLPAYSKVNWKISSSELGTPALATGTKWLVDLKCIDNGHYHWEHTF